MDTPIIALLSSTTNIVAVLCAAGAAVLFYIKYLAGDECACEIDGLQRPRGPTSYPIIGNIASFYSYDVPFQAFGDLAKKYGQVVRLRLGSTPTIIVNGLENIKEVLITKSSHFENRPHFPRFYSLIKGYKENCK